MLVGVLTIAVVGGGVAAAVGITGNDDSASWPVAVATESVTARPSRVQRPESEDLRQAVIARLSLLRRPATGEDTAPAQYLPSVGNGSPVKLSEADLAFARKVPGADASWILPLRTGGLMMIGQRGGTEFTPEQLDAGTVMIASDDEAGDTVVTGIVPDGTQSVSIATATGDSASLPVQGNGYSRTFAPGANPSSVSVTSKAKRRVVAAVAGS